MNYKEAINSLYELRLFGSKFGLENSYRLAALCGNPQDSLRFIHVAGTNGKGSTCAMLESIYRNAGLKTGFFTSPHLISFTERIQVNRAPITEDETARLTDELLKLMKVENGQSDDHEQWSFRPTFFEVVTVMALKYFAEKKCDLVILETGMGGRLDATNIVQPLAAVITNVQLDHQTWLGNTTREIAREKAGIIKAKIPAITATSDPGALEEIKKTAAEMESSLTIVGEPEIRRAAELELTLLGKHQLANAACALATVEALQRIIPVSQENICNGLKNVQWPGRLQLIRHKGKEVLLDGAHNPDGAAALRAVLEGRFSDREKALMLGLFTDKNWKRICEIIIPAVHKLFLVPVQSERTCDPAEIGRFCQEFKPNVEVETFPSLAAGLDAALGNDFVVVTGSLHLVGEAMEHLGISPSERSERSLNEWTAVKPA
jgi:dihydrofolate synthase/folylpolyglutamate synthase